MNRIAVTLGCVLLSLSIASAGAQGPAAAVSVEPITAVLDAFKTHDVVALGEGNHGNEQGFAFRLSLLRDPRFPTVVNDIVVETGNALYQDVIDRFISGQDISDVSLRRVWQNTTQPFTTFDVPIYEDFFRAVRALNQSLPRERQIRVLLGDPPIEWDAIHDKAESQRWLGLRDQYPADLIQREVIAKHRRALIVYGDIHLQRENLAFNYVDNPKVRTIVGLLEHSQSRVKVFSIWTNTWTDLDAIQPGIAVWPLPSLALIRGTTLGAAEFTVFNPFDGDRFSMTGDGSLMPVPRTEWNKRTMEQQFDAILYIGAPPTITYARLSPQLCSDPTYMTMRFERFALIELTAGTEQLKKFCEAATRQP